MIQVNNTACLAEVEHMMITYAHTGRSMVVDAYYVKYIDIRSPVRMPYCEDDE